MKNQNKFNFFIPSVTFEKAKDEKTGVTNYLFKSIASDDSEDSSGETLVPDGFDIKPLLDYGTVNWNHKAKDNPRSIIGHPTNAEIKDNKLIVSGLIYGDSKLGRDVVETAKMLEKSSGGKRRFGISIEGVPLKRSTINPKRIEKARITGIAVTHVPVNRNTVFELIKGEQSDDFIDYEFEKSNANGSMDPEYLVDITDKDKGIRVTMDKSLTIKISKTLTTDSPSGKAMRKESLEKKPKNLFEFQKAVVTISKGYELGMVPDEMIEKARMHKYLRKEGNRYIYKELVPKEKKEGYDSTFELNGRTYKTKGFTTVDAVNKFMEKNPEYGLIGIRKQQVLGKMEEFYHVARKDDMGKGKNDKELPKVGDKFKSKNGNIYEIVEFTKNPNVIKYKVTYKDGRVDNRQGSLSEVTKFDKQNKKNESVFDYHQRKIEEQNKKMHKPMRDVMNK